MASAAASSYLSISSLHLAIGGGNVENSTSTGVVTDILTETQSAGTTGNTVQASDEEPRFVIKNDNTGKETAYKGSNITKVISS